MKKRKWPILFLSITLILVVAFVTNQIAIGNRYSELMDSYRNDKIEYRSDGTITGYSNVYFSPLGLYGSVRFGILERKIDGTDEIKKIYGDNRQAVSRSVYSWYRDYLYDGYFENIRDILYKYMINSIYQYISLSDLSDGRFSEYAKNLFDSGINLYVIYDDQTMDRQDFSAFLSAIYDKAEELHIKGVVTDIEPLRETVSDRKSVLQNLAGFLKFCSDSSHKDGLEIINSIPIWYDGISEDLSGMIISSSDRIALMNYSKKNKIDNIKNEMAIAVKSGISVDNVIELGDIDKAKGIDQDITYSGSSGKQIESDLYSVKKSYSSINFSYHQIRNLYSLFYSAYILDMESNEPLYIDGIFSSYSNGCTRFYRLKYGESYTVRSKDGNVVTQLNIQPDEDDNGYVHLKE